jgi:hypothetical protein
MFSGGMKDYGRESEPMLRKDGRKLWVAVRIQRGFVSDVKAYDSEKSARRQERSWRGRLNADYDETCVSCVRVNEHVGH